MDENKRSKLSSYSRGQKLQLSPSERGPERVYSRNGRHFTRSDPEVHGTELGPDSSNKYPCYYFRHAFTSDFVPVSATLKVMMDDGVVVYLNGTEVARTNMPAGATAYGDWASSGVSGSDEQQWHTFALDPSLIVTGGNLLAAELHQSSPTSSDIGFSLELKTGAPVPAPPIVGIMCTPEGVALEWEDGVLQFSPSLFTPDWQDMPGEASPYTPPPGQSSAWYRLRR